MGQMDYRLSNYIFGISDPRKFPAERLRQLLAIKLKASDSLSGNVTDTLIPLLVSKRKIDDMNKIRVHINALVGEEVISADQMKTLVFLRGIEVMASECIGSMESKARDLQKFMGELPR